MARMFGTDGVRGVANTELTPELALSLGRAAARVLTRHTHKRATIIIGKDTRISGDMLENALAAGICSAGADAVLLGVVPTPAVAYLVREYKADAGAVISASHNPVQFNGIKFFSNKGFKLPDDIEDEIENYIKNPPEEEPVTGGDVGTVTSRADAIDDYSAYVAGCCDTDLAGLRVGVDCADGASFVTAKKIFSALKVDCVFTGDEPNGRNINDGVGSTHLGNLASLVKREKLDIGVAFDGDADRCLAVDENGDEIDGDKIIAILAKGLKEQKKLKKDTAVVTVMSNLGFTEFAQKNGIKVATTAVGDRYVLEEMLRSGYNIGGEQSGHVILLDYATTGDGELTAVRLLGVLARSGKKASELAAVLEKYPQTLVNVQVTAEQKAAFKASEELAGYIESKQRELMSQGRVLVRVSGTEPYIRIMIEGKNLSQIEQMAKDIADKLKERL